MSYKNITCKRPICQQLACKISNQYLFGCAMAKKTGKCDNVSCLKRNLRAFLTALSQINDT